MPCELCEVHKSSYLSSSDHLLHNEPLASKEYAYSQTERLGSVRRHLCTVTPRSSLRLSMKTPLGSVSAGYTRICRQAMRERGMLGARHA